MIDPERAQEVREAVQRTFGHLPVPASEELIAQGWTTDEEARERTRQRLAGRTWQSLDATFFEADATWASYCYLSPVAYRYYLPALLVGALESGLERSGLPHSVLYSLGPDFYWLYFEGQDRCFEARQALLDDAQYAAVGAFLGLFLADPSQYRYGHLAAQALRWRWNRLLTPELAAAQAYYQRLHSFVCPEPSDPEIAALCAEIRSAFASTPRPPENDLCACRDDEAAENAMELRGLAWSSIHPELLANCYTALTFLSNAAHRYYLPAFLIADLMYLSNWDPIFSSNAEPVFGLTYGLYEPEEADLTPADRQELEGILGAGRLAFLEAHPPVVNERRLDTIHRMRGFTLPERRAIIRYLEYRAEDDDFHAAMIRPALQSYWLPSLSHEVTE